MTAMTVTIPTLETERLILRGPKTGDFEELFVFLSTDRARFVGGPITDKVEAWRRWSHVAGQWVLRGYGMFVLTLKGSDAPLGICGLWNPFTWPEREIGWSIWSPQHEGKGYAFEAANAALDYAFLACGWDTAVSYIDPDNNRSIALAERLGAQRDDAATKPDDDEPPALVYRHPRRTA